MNISEYVELWVQGDTATNFFHRQVSLVLGLRNVAKNNFIQFLAQNNSLLKNPSTSFKPTLAPVIVHTASNATIYDFDFDDSAESVGLPLGISPTYLLQKIISSTEQLQIILLINFSSTKHGIDKHHFIAQIRKISSWIKNIDNYANSIGLIVTNVANVAENQALVQFELILNHVETFLEQLRKENSHNLPILKLLNIFLRKTTERIGIFRQANNPSNQKALQNEWLKLRVLLDNIKFSPTNITDFNFYSQPATGHSLTRSIGNELDERIANKIDVVFQKLQNEFEDIHNAALKLEKIDSISIIQTTNKNLREVLLDLETKLNKLNIYLSSSFIDDTLRLDNYLQFLLSIDNLTLPEWLKAMQKITDYIKSFHSWNNFLRVMDFVTSSYAVQKNCKKLYNIFVDKPITELNDPRLQQFVKDYYHHSYLYTSYHEIANQTFSPLKILSLESIFRSNLKPRFTNKNSTGVTEIFGEYLILSDIISKFPKAKFLSLNAASKIFLDTNITRSVDELPFQMVSIISPVWELMQDVGIILDGRKGYTSIIPTGTGDYPGGNGNHGQVGDPGKSAGHFLGVADLFIHNGHRLLISANGGKGGNGTDGDKGGVGQTGDTAVKDCERTADFESFQREELSGLLYHEYCVYGRHGGDGGNGGNGGVGAEGGYAGDITLIGFDKETVRTSHVEGRRGENGKGGAGGEAGENGKSWKITKKTFWWGKPQCDQESNDFCGARSPVPKAANGVGGLDAYRRETLKNAVKIEHPHWSSLLSTYRKYMAGRPKFLEKLNKNPSIMDLDADTSLADEFFYLDTVQNSTLTSRFELLLYRTEYYLTKQQSEIAKMVQQAILAKLISIRNQRSRNLIVDLKKYVEREGDRIKNYDIMSRASYIRSEVWNHKSEISSFLSVGDENGCNNSEVTELIHITQVDMSNFNKSYEIFEHEMAILKTLVTMKDTFNLLSFIEKIGKKILESTLPANKYFYSEIPAAAEIKNSVLQLTKTKSDNWRKKFEPVFKNLIQNSTGFLNSKLKENYNSLLETKPENFYEISKNIRDSVRKIVSTANLKIEQTLIKKLEIMWFLCESEFQNCHSLENHKNVVQALQVAKGFVYSKVQQFSDNIVDINDLFLSIALKNPEYVVVGNSSLTNSLLQLQILFHRIKQTFKFSLPELVKLSFNALEADTKRMECFYTDLAYYQDTKRFESVFQNSLGSLIPILSNLSSSISLSILQYTYQNDVLIPFYQLDFPFAYEDASDVEIIADNYHTFKKKASTAIDNISSKIKRGPIIDLVSRTKKVDLLKKVQELYRWKGEDHEKTIRKLLRGKAVTIKSDILKQNSYEQAIKVHNINLELQTKNQTLQKELDKELENFAVTLKHCGVSYYKCRDSIFTFTHSPISIYYTFASSGNNRVEENGVYSMLKNADYLLSPFTIWRVEITHLSHKNTSIFKVLEKYEHNIDIVLKAGSMYLLDRNVTNLPFVPNSDGDYCNSEAMRKYYKNEDIIFQMKSSDFASDTKKSSRRKRGVGHGDLKKIGKEFNYSMDFCYQTVQYKIPVLNITEANSGHRECIDFQYNLNDCLVLLNLMVQYVTDSKQSYFQNCPVNHSEVRQFALEIIRKFEESLEILSKNVEGDEYSFDPAPLMEELEQDIINNGGLNINKILLNAVSPRKSSVKKPFFKRLWDKLAKYH